MAIRVPKDHLVIGHNQIAEDRLAAFLKGDRELREPTRDITAIIKAGRSDAFRTAFLSEFHPKTPSRRKREGSRSFEKAASRAPWNPPTRFFPKIPNVHSNENVVSGEELANLKRRLKRKLTKLKEKLGEPPIVLLDYHDTADVFTTEMLKKTLQNLLDDEYGNFVRDFRANLKTDGVMMNDLEKYVKKFERALGNGGIVIGGGTFNDADDAHGEWFQDNIMSYILKNSAVRALMVCWSYQVMARAIAKKYGFDIFVINGALRWGTFPTQILNRGPLTKIFRRGEGRTVALTSTYTHSDHVVFVDDPLGRLGDKIVGEWDEETSTIPELEVIAFDPLNGLPVGYKTHDDRIIGLASHPEVDRHEDLETIREFVRNSFGGWLGDRYDLSADNVANNFFPYVEGRMLLRTNLGPAFYGGIIEFFTDSLLRDLEYREK